jgi:D-xylonolactonase
MKTIYPTIELFADQSLSCGEGPVWDIEAKTLFWTDSAGDEIFAGTAETGYKLLSKGIHAASLTLHDRGGLMLCGRKGFYHLDRDGKVRMVSNQCEGVQVDNINDIIADPAGRVFGGQECFQEKEKYNTGFLFKIDTDGKSSIVDEGLHLSNGMGFSPQADKFYLVDTIARSVYQYDYDIQTGDISNRKILITIDRDEGLPDGMTVDADGFIWIARWFGKGLSRYDPDGKVERKIELTVSQPSSLAFGGKDYNEIFITTAATYWETSLAPRNYNYSSLRGGGVYRLVQDIRGLPEYKAKV